VKRRQETVSNSQQFNGIKMKKDRIDKVFHILSDKSSMRYYGDGNNLFRQGKTA